MRKRRRAVAPHFKTPVPYNPLTGERMPLEWPPAVSSMMVVRVSSISDDYLTCEGWHPDSHSYLRDLIVAKPFLLRVNPVGAIRYPEYTETFASVASGKRTTVHQGDYSEVDYAGQQRIEPPYFVGELLVAGRMEGIIGEEVLEPVISGGYWSTPTEVYLTGSMPMGGMEEDDHPVYWMDLNVAGRVWSEHRLRPFVLTQDLIPADTASDPDATVQATWLDSPGSAVTLYPAHQNGVPSGDAFFSHGFGRGLGSYFRGTYGWAKYQPNGTGNRGEWQIVTLYAETIASVVVYDASIASGATGNVQLWWVNKNASAKALVNSGYSISLFNDLDTALEVGAKLKAYFDRNDYVWRPVSAPDCRHFAVVQTGWTNTKAAAGVGSRVSETVSVKTCNYDDATTGTGDAFDVKTKPQPNKDTALFHSGNAKEGEAGASIVEWAFAPNGDKVIVSDIWDLPIGRVLWEGVDTANIRDGWHLCDGNNGTPDLSGMFIMCIDNTGLGDENEDEIGDGTEKSENTAGFRWHGGGNIPAVAADNDHDNHEFMTVAGIDSLEGREHPAVVSGACSIGGVMDFDHGEFLGSGEAIGDLDKYEHTKTDNRPRYYVMAAIMRIN